MLIRLLHVLVNCFGREQPKLIKDVIPISTVRENNIRWNKDGLYYGTIPDENVC